MVPESLELELKSRIPVSQSVLQKLKTHPPNVSGNASIDAEFLGGVLRGGKFSWFAIGSNIEIFSLKTGQRVAGQSFDGKSVVTCVAEVTASELNTCLLMIAVQRSPVGGLLYLFSVQGSRIVHRIDVIDKITSCCFICDVACSRGTLKAFNGCVAVGAETGEVFLIDLNLNRCKEIISRQIPYNQHSDDSTCKILSAPIDLDEVRAHVKKSRVENVNLGIRLDVSVIEQPSAITAILSMPQMQMIVVGFESGILALFNLSDLNALHLAYPPEPDSPLMKFAFLEPADDPRPCVYIWAFHANESNFPFAVMHAVTFSSKTYQDCENVYETFQWCRPDLTIPIYEKDSIPISCQSVTKIITEEEDEQYSLCLLAWTNRISSFVLVFDLNQWYKEQMPRVCEWRDYPSYLAPFPIHEIFDKLTAQRNSIRMTSEYQEVLQWLLNMGLLPEIVWNQTTLPEIKNDTITATPYPYRILNDFYTEQRQRFYDIDRSNIAPKTNSCRCLYIDSFIDRECNSHLLRNEWSNGLGDGLYPPPSLQAMLRILLIPGISLENKYMLFVYLFLDLHNFLEGEHFDVVQNLIKFPAVFKLNSSLIKTTQAFWNLDHNEYEIAIRELISPLTSDRFITQWQQELLVNTLLIRDMPHLALQAIRSPGPSINTSLRIKTLLANNLVTEAFELQRSKFDENLLVEFFKGCHEHKKWNNVLHLALTEREGEILCKFLQTCDTLLSENLHLLYLLQRNKYIEAVTYLDETKHKPRSMLMQRKLESTQDLIMSSYKLAMNSTNRTLCDQYMSIKNRLQVDVQQDSAIPKPLSSELNPFIVDANANVVGSVFHRAMISAKKTGFSTTSNKSHIPLLGSIRIEIDPYENVEQKPISEPKPYIGQLKRRKEITYENHADPDAKQPAAKRQRVDSFSIADVEQKKHAPGINSYLFTSLTNQSHTFGRRVLSQMDADEDGDEIIMDETVANETDQSQRNSYGELCDTINLLSTPVVRSSRLDKHSRIDSRCHTPQSILKQRHTDVGSSISRRSVSPSLTHNSAKRSVDFNAKSFCYTIPSQDDEYRLDAIQETVNLRETDEDDSSSVNTSNSIKGRRPIHSGKKSTASNSVDEFYSPETSKVKNESSVQEMDQSDISRIISQPEIPTPTTSYSVSPRRKLRSKTPEKVVMSSTRITRSQSKLNLDDTADQENTAKQPVLNTSTPKRATPRRSPSRFLSRNVITSNALKVQEEVEQTQRKLSESQEAHELDDNDLVDSAATESKQRNLLKDASELSFKHRSMYVIDSTDEGEATQSKRNLLQDSSAFASDYSVGTSESTKESTQVDESVEMASTTTEEFPEQMTQDEPEKSTHEENITIETKEPIESSTEHVQSTSTQEEDHAEVGNVESIVIPMEPNAYANENPNPIVEAAQITETITTTVTEETSITVTERMPTNYLVDSSTAVSDSIMQKFSRYEHFTSSFFNETERPKENLLQDSDDDVVNIDDLESKSGQSENNSISSDSEIESEDVEEEEEEGDEQDESDIDDNDAIKINDDDVVEISDSEDDIESNKSNNDDDFGGMTAPQEQFNMYEDLKYDLNDELGIPTTSQQPQSSQFEHVTEYNITEMQTAPIELDIPSQEQAMNEMIYGDLNVADAEMLNLDVHNEAFGFEMHGHREVADNGIHTNVVEIPHTVSQHLVLEHHAERTEPVQQSSGSGETPQQEITTTENVDNLFENPVNAEINVANDANEVMSTNDEISEAVDGDTNVVGAPDTEPQPLQIVSDESPIIEPVQQPSGSSETTEQENVLTENIESADINVTSNVNEPVGTNNEPSSTAHDESDTANIPPQSEATANETNILDKAMVIDESEMIVDETEVTEQEVVAQSEPMEEDKEPMQSDVVESTEVEPRKTRAKSQQPPNIETSNSDLEQPKPSTSVARDFTIKLKRSEIKQLQSTEKVAAVDQEPVKTQPEPMEEETVPEQSDVIESTEVKSRSTRAKSQQPAINETSNVDSEETKQSTSKARDFTIKLKRSEIEQLQAAEKDSVEKPSRKKRAASEQKEATVKLKKSEDESLQTDEPSRKKRGNSQQKEVPTKTKGDDEPSTSKAAIPKRQRTKSTTDSELGEKFDAEESVPSRRLRKAVSHQSLSEISEHTDETSTPKKSRTPRKSAPRRAVSHQSLSSTSDSDGKSTKEPVKRVTRSKSIQSIQSIESDATSVASRSKLATSKQRTDDTDTTKRKKRINSESSESELGDKFDADESRSSRGLRKAVSHQVLSKIDESVDETSSPKKSKTPRKTAPRRAESHQSLSSTSQSDSKPVEELSKPAQRVTRSKSTQSIQSTDSEATSTSRTKRATSKQRSDDIDSQKETKTSKRKKNTTLPPIPENDSPAKSIIPDEYLETSRLTRAQRATIEKYSKLKEKVAETETKTKRSTRKPKSDAESSKTAASDHSDTESVASQKSSTSKMSKKSKISEASSSQRSTRQRSRDPKK